MGTRDRYGELVDDEGVLGTHTPQKEGHPTPTLTTSEGGVGSTDPLGQGVHTVDPVDHDLRCRGGWLPEDPNGQAVPCLVCRPHLIGRRRQLDRLLAGPYQ
ncbi:hypothetical protein GCM10028783_30400 [Modestobacter muralis]